MTHPRPTDLLPAPLREGLRGIALLDRVEAGDWSWVGDLGLLAFSFTARLSVPPSRHMPERSAWVALVSPRYPEGDVTVYPAADGGITATFPHQSYNAEPERHRHWRKGNPCVARPKFSPGPGEPLDAGSRLAWHVGRLLAWMNAAASGHLLAPGDLTEFPALPGPVGGRGTVLFSEDPSTFHAWEGRHADGGTVDLAEPRGMPGILAVRHMKDRNGGLIASTAWGTRMEPARGTKPSVGVWFALPDMPIIEPWTWPRTWGEMEAAFNRVGVSLVGSLLANARLLRSGRRHPMLIGFPVAERVGDTPTRMHWIAVRLPAFSHGTLTAKGFRPDEKGYGRRDRSLLHLAAAVDWVKTENWAPDQLLTRGTALAAAARSERYLLLGAGALGSAVGQALARAGARDVAVVDGETLVGGNLARHDLGIGSVGRNKAEEVAARINDCNPHATAIGIPTDFPKALQCRQGGRVVDSTVVVDCTGDDGLLDELAATDWGPSDRWFISISLGWGAKRLYCFAARGTWFPAEDFRERFSRWRHAEAGTRAEVGGAPWEGVGCWHPVFPATGAEVTAMAMAATRFIADVVGGRTPDRAFMVYGEHGHALADADEQVAA